MCPRWPSSRSVPARAAAALVLDGAEAPTIGAICRRLDGLPLALELAAARLRLLSPAALLARLEEGLGVLAGGPIDVPDRQRTLRDTIAWSVALLPPREAALFGRLGVFRGGFDLAAALRGRGARHRGHRGRAARGALGARRPQPRARQPTSRGQPRFGMLETIREYAREHLEDEPTLRDRHLAHYLALAEEADRALNGPGHAAAARRLGADIENLRAALSWAETSGRHAELLRLAAALGLYWRLHGDIREGRDRLERAISLAPTGDPALARALVGLARIILVLGDPAQRRPARPGRPRRLPRHQGTNGPRVGRSSASPSSTCETGRLDEAIAVLERVLEIGHRVPDATLRMRRAAPER